VADLHTFRRVVVGLALERGDCGTLVIVPTVAAAEQLRRTMREAAPGEGGSVTTADPVTRDQLYERLAARLNPQPVRLAAPERAATGALAVRHVTAAGVAPPFRLRPRLMAEIARFYDQLKRQGQPVTRYEELLAESLERDLDLDRGARRMLQQTRFLAAV